MNTDDLKALIEKSIMYICVSVIVVPVFVVWTLLFLPVILLEGKSK